MDTSPTSRPRLITGKCLNRPIVIVSIVESDRVVFRGHLWVFRHVARDGIGQGRRPAIGDRRHDVALGNDPDNGAARVDDHHRPYAPLRQIDRDFL